MCAPMTVSVRASSKLFHACTMTRIRMNMMVGHLVDTCARGWRRDPKDPRRITPVKSSVAVAFWPGSDSDHGGVGHAEMWRRWRS